MYQCPNCSAGLRYDIKTAKLHCDFCESSFDPYSIDKEKDAQESRDSSGEFDAVVFRCPQCGAQIISSDETAAAFCNYCGGSTILTGNMRGEKRPDRIIPFKLDKEDCKEIYRKRIRRFHFAPKSFLEPDHLDKMTGIYMPYWIYDVKMNNRNTLRSTHDRRKGDYIYHDHYDMTVDTDLTYSGISYDAASDFADDISEQIAPFNVKDFEPFTPSYLCGFHADIQDLPADVYQEKAISFAKEETVNRMKDLFDKTSKGKSGSPEEAQTRVTAGDTVKKTGLFPVWFLTWRKDDRVAYAVINGENGRISVDLPVDIRKYLLLVAILTVPLFFALESFLALTAITGMFLVMFIALITVLVYKGVCTDVRNKDEKVGDAGFQRRKSLRMEEERQQKLREEELKAGAMFASDQEAEGQEFAGQGSVNQEDAAAGQELSGKMPAGQMPASGSSKSKKKKYKKKNTIPKKPPLTSRQKMQQFFVRICLIVPAVIGGLYTYLWMHDVKTFSLLAIPAGLLGLYVMYSSSDETGVDPKGEPDSLRVLKETFYIPVIALAGCIAGFLDLPSDGLFYGLTILMLAQTCLTFISMIRKYNMLATRPMPYFERSGGDERA